jgi:hypothetical protein
MGYRASASSGLIGKDIAESMYFKKLSQHLPRVTEKSDGVPQV